MAFSDTAHGKRTVKPCAPAHGSRAEKADGGVKAGRGRTTIREFVMKVSFALAIVAAYAVGFGLAVVVTPFL